MALKKLLKELVERSGSDLHLVSGSAPILRINGELKPAEYSTSILGRGDVANLFEPYLTEPQRVTLTSKQDLNTSLVTEGFGSEASVQAQRFRVCLFWDRNGMSAALRLIPTRIPQLSNLFLPDTESIFRGLVDRRRGLTLVVGQVGSGKSTTIASMIDAINSERSERILTIEDPIEYVHTSKMSLISQREIGIDVDSFEQGGLSIMRADPDVVLVSELRTPEAVRIALALAETGHLVFSTVHATTVSEAVRRLVESFPDNKETMQAMIARCLNAVITQRLIQKADKSGRLPVHEIMIVNPRIRRMIADGETDLSLAIEAGRGEGMCTMDDSIANGYRAGIISYESALPLVQDRDRLGLPPSLREPAQ